MIPINDIFISNNPNLLDHKKCIFVIGAGISVASGIPDFRSPDGIFATLKKELKINGKELFTYNFGLKEESRKIYLKCISSLKRLCDSAEPNETHKFLTNFPKSRIYTQNIDGLEEKSGMVFTKTDKTKGIYLHGNLAQISCQYCGFKKPFEENEILFFEKGEEVFCIKCEERRENCLKNGIRKKPIGIMHPSIIHYQQMNPDGAFIGKMCEKDLDCDLLIVIGTSLSVDGVKKLVKTFCRASNVKGKRILVNLTKPNKEWEDFFDYFYEGDCNKFVKTVEEIKNKPKSIEKSNLLEKHTYCPSKSKTNNKIAINSKVVKEDACSSFELPFSDLLERRKSKNQIKNSQNLKNKPELGEVNNLKSENKLEGFCETTQSFQSHRNHLDDSSIIEIDAQVRKLSIDNKHQNFERKLKILTKSLSDEETIGMNVLEEVIKTSTQTEIDLSNCSSLQSEIELIVKDSLTKEEFK